MEHAISICFSTTDAGISSLIRWITRSEISHCYITFRDHTLQQVMVMEADWWGFRVVPWESNVMANNRLVARFWVNAPEEKQLNALRKLTCFLGVGYDYLRLAMMTLRRVRARVEEPFEDTKRIICSQSVMVFLNECGITNIRNPAAWTPEDVYAYVKNNPDFFTRQE